MWTRLNPFLTVRRMLDLWERQIHATEQANAIAVVNLSEGAGTTAAAVTSRLADVSKSISPKKPSAHRPNSTKTPPKKLDASNVLRVTRQSRIERQMRLQGRKLHGDPPNPSPSSPSGSTDAA